VGPCLSAPGQFLGDKIGQPKITGTRSKAGKTLGAKLDVGVFHDELVKAGALPLNILKKRSWIA